MSSNIQRQQIVSLNIIYSKETMGGQAAGLSNYTNIAVSSKEKRLMRSNPLNTWFSKSFTVNIAVLTMTRSLKLSSRAEIRLLCKDMTERLDKHTPEFILMVWAFEHGIMLWTWDYALSGWDLSLCIWCDFRIHAPFNVAHPPLFIFVICAT